ncbi:MAG: pimeloyl-ACP methyl ester carboxylesterase/membrane protein DedA with SNARE-associated domain [Chlamydiales bacterium]|jgi:pimeloyl-ACP methyl ester carboxylesterase/membrane protein DedA with SNARE-associated domain
MDNVRSGGRRWRRVALVYGALLLLSHGSERWRASAPAADGAPPLGQHIARVQAVDSGLRTDETVELAYNDGFDAAGPKGTGTPLLLLHGSPGDAGNFETLAAALPDHYRLIAPDLPGFGNSYHRIPDYSIAAHADYVLQLLDTLKIEAVHVVAFSMGGGVAAHLAQLAPERVRSISLVAAIGVQETELFGTHMLNHAVHALQLGAIQTLRWLTPHFGTLDVLADGIPYARNFYDSDQRPLRGLLAGYAGPMLIVHGERDFLVPPETAYEHERIVPQSELQMLDTSHFLLWTLTDRVAELIDDFVSRVERGQALTRPAASAERVQRAQAPFNPHDAPRFEGPALLLALLLLAAATLVSEDLTCIGAGLLVAQGRMGFVPATLACFVGIFVGDLLLYLAGRWLGRPALDKRPLKWFVKSASVESATHWFEARGARVIFLSRFLPGLRLPTYVAAGILRMRVSVFALYFLLAGALWTPILVGCAALAGHRALDFLQSFERWALPAFLLFAIAILGVQRLIVPLFSYRGRRLLVGSWRRKRQFEFWPPIAFYIPVTFYIAWLAVRQRSLRIVTAVNPGIPTGGFVGESKADILDALAGSAEWVARHHLLLAAATTASRQADARAFMATEGLDFPIILKPDVGQRGSGVRILRTEEVLNQALAEMAIDCLLQEYVDGPEYGVFYLRRAGSERGEIFSITEKRLPVVEGDGESTLEHLILRDERAVCAAAVYFQANAQRLQEVPDAGESIELVELGAHCRGAVFLDGQELLTPALAARIDQISRGFDGFHFGRYDMRAPSAEAFSNAQDFKIIELNGLTSEATHIYDARHGAGHAYRVLFEQWRVAFQIAAQNQRDGAAPATLRELILAWREYGKLQQRHPSA